jgi:hypothetical protein
MTAISRKTDPNRHVYQTQAALRKLIEANFTDGLCP